MKRLILLLSLFTTTGCLFADRVYVEDIVAKQGDKADLKICYQFDGTTQYSGYQLELSLPKGVKADVTNNAVAYVAGDCHDETFIISNNYDEANDVFIFVAFSLQAHTLSGTGGVLLTVPVEIDDAMDVGMFYGKVANVELSHADGVTTEFLDDASFVVTCQSNVPEPPEVYQLIYMLDGEEYKTYAIEYGADITEEAAPEKEGYTFSGWSEIPSTMPATDVTVIGSFTINNYSLTYIVDGEVYKTYPVKYGAAITVEEEPTKDGYAFSGWSEIPDTMPAHDVVITGSFVLLDAIEGVQVGKEDDSDWYTLDGRKLNRKPTLKGVYICNGKRVYVK